MLSRRIEFVLSAFIVVFGLLLCFVAIPLGVDTPSSMRSILLSPAFWPTILAVGLTAAGVLLGIAQLRRKREDVGDVFEPLVGSEILRLVGFVVLAVIYFEAIAFIGMVWASVLAFAAFVFLTGAPNKIIGLAAALILPILLFAFFYHVAGVNIPQSDVLRLP
ncbi:tripartite tricarboxylate transporter TctB family protein [Jiella marina]|uniref:tripartite tricarboxylate transporter TctB family protein n=1 Tax=Jiella sp. LLJ827 TaxID=2917712 RepID=UPI0021007CEC|nr:tripartite tricarboxylate transporter TctB family protein [Jiella sp. LLJ827]MCQ0988246.1 tripartite tricarboxylate transporter TctB family protein [Jiella sp. LLJ827]